ncbi:MAG: DUF4954 family protein [Spirochaetaceae bacterium]|nr:MAG: DUF4954 family protein [Spirochaetaceae bacterium]
MLFKSGGESTGGGTVSAARFEIQNQNAFTHEGEHIAFITAYQRPRALLQCLMSRIQDGTIPFVLETQDHTLKPGTGPLDDDLISELQSRGNTAEDWAQVQATPGAVLDEVINCHFSGSCILGTGLSLRNSIFHNVVLEDAVQVHNCSMIRGYRISCRSRIAGSILDHDHESVFGNDLTIPPAVEISPYQVPLCAGLDWESTVAALDGTTDQADHTRAVSDFTAQIHRTHAYIGPDSVINGGAVLRRAYVGAGRTIEGAFTIEDSTLLGSGHGDAAACRGGGIIRGSILTARAWVGDFGRCSASMLFEESSVSNGGQVSLSVLGFRTGVSQGEVTASVLGPLVGVHHKSLVIACMWPEGLGNVGSGAQVGSNHTSRLPDQSMIAGEGMFFGLATAIKYPANYRESPYSVIATGLITGPQRVRFPFSLITMLDDAPADAPAGYNRIIPGWMISHNLFALLRNELKFARRFGQARPTVQVIRAKTATLVQDAVNRLESVDEPAQWYDEGGISGVGKNALLESDRRRGIAAYRDFLSYFRLREAIEQGTSLSREQVAEGHELLDRLSIRAKDSRARDFHRGVRVFAEYRQTHPEPSEDPELRAVLALLEREADALNRLGPA